MRWSIQDGTTTKHGYMRLLCDGMDIGIDVFPFRAGADPEAIKAKARAIVDVLNAAEAWNDGDNEGTSEALRAAIDALPELSTVSP